MNEFVARKGLVSLKSSSFEQTIRVSGSISSPAEAFLTSSWAMNAVTASYIATNFDSVYDSIGTGSQNVLVNNVWQEVKLHTNVSTSSNWTHLPNSGQFTCSLTDIYTFNVDARVQKTAGGNSTAGLRLLENGQEISGSYCSNTYTSNNIPTNLSVSVTKKVDSGSSVKIEFGGSSTNLQIVSFPTFGSTPVYTYSTKLTITRK